MEVKLHNQTVLFQPLFLKLILNKSFEYFRVRLLYKNWKWMDCYDICMVNFGLTWIDIYGWVMKWTQKFFGTEYLRRVPSVQEFPKDSVNNWVLHGWYTDNIHLNREIHQSELLRYRGYLFLGFGTNGLATCIFPFSLPKHFPLIRLAFRGTQRVLLILLFEHSFPDICDPDRPDQTD